MKAKLEILFFLSLALMTITPQYVYGQFPGGYVKRPMKRNESLLTKKELILHDLLNKPMGLDFDVKTASYRTVKDKLCSKYKVYDDNEGDGRHDFWVDTQDNVQCRKMRLHGWSFETFYFRIDSSGESEYRMLSYDFEIKKSVFPDIVPPYQYLDKIVSDFHEMGIDISYVKKDNPETATYEVGVVAIGTYKTSNLKYEIELAHGWSNKSEKTWNFKICLWIYN